MLKSDFRTTNALFYVVQYMFWMSRANRNNQNFKRCCSEMSPKWNFTLPLGAVPIFNHRAEWQATSQMKAPWDIAQFQHPDFHMESMMALTQKGDMGMCGPEDPLFTHLPWLTRVSLHVKELKSQLTKPAFEKKMKFQAATVSIFVKFSLSSPQLLKFSVHKTPLSEAKSVPSPALQISWQHTPT